jgi:hypothetical protein
VERNPDEQPETSPLRGRFSIRVFVQAWIVFPFSQLSPIFNIFSFYRVLFLNTKTFIISIQGCRCLL